MRKGRPGRIPDAPPVASLTSPVGTGAVVSALEIGVRARLAARCMYPAFALAVIEVLAAITVAEPFELVTTIIIAPEMPRVAVRLMPPRPS